jgi:hypothetical protein
LDAKNESFRYGLQPAQRDWLLVVALAAPSAKSFVGEVGRGQHQASQHGHGNLGGMRVEPVSGRERSQHQAYSRQPCGQDPFLSVLAEADPE